MDASPPSPSWIGIDVAKATFEAALITPVQKEAPLRELAARSFPRTQEGAAALLAWADKTHPGASWRALMEVTGKYSTELAAWLAALRPSLEPAIVSSRLVKGHGEALDIRNKTDRMDARLIAHFGLERAPVARQPLPEHQRQLQALVRERDALVRDRAAHSMRKGEGSVSKIVIRIQASLAKSLDTAIDKLDKAIAELIADDERMSGDLALLDSIPGVAKVSASIILAELGDLRRFTRARQIAAFAGLSPRQRKSGTSLQGPTHLCKRGSPYARRTLYLCAMAAIRGDNPLARFYKHLRAHGKPAMAAVGAVMRKLVVLMRAIVISGKPFDGTLGSPLEPCGQNQKTCGQNPKTCEQLESSCDQFPALAP